jgi:hypothetical protein
MHDMGSYQPFAALWIMEFRILWLLANHHITYVATLVLLICFINGIFFELREKWTTVSRIEAYVTILFVILANLGSIAIYYFCWETQCIAAGTNSDLVFSGKILFRLIFAFMNLLIWVAGWVAIATITFSAATGRAVVVSNGKRTMEELPDGTAHLFINLTNVSVLLFGTVSYLHKYEPTGTYRPDWLDWIGM